MRKINKLISVILSLSMIFSVCTFASADSAAVSEDLIEEYYKAVELFKGMEIWSDDMSVKSADELITRAQFADILAKITALNITEYNGASYFTDVTKETVGYNAINQLASAGIISGNPDGTFEPDANITLYQASKLIISALGYTLKAELKGGYFAGYLIVADKLDIIDNLISADEFISKQNALNMLYRALFVGVNDIVAVKNGEATFQASDDETLLSQRFSIYKAEGKITENSYTSLIGDTTVGDNEVKIDGIVLNAGTTDAEDLIGYSVSAYYKSIKGSGLKTIVHITDKELNDVLKIDADDIISFKDGVYKYTDENEKEKEAKIGINADIIYNGKALTYNPSYLIPTEGYVELIGDGASRGYETVVVNDIKNIVVNSINADEMIVTGKYGAKPVNFSTNGGKKVYIKDMSGKEISLDDIFTWDVISYTQSIDGNLIRATVVRDYVTGSVTGILGSSAQKIEIEEYEFEISKNFPNSGQYEIKVGDRGDFLLDVTGKISAFIKNETAGLVYGYLVDAEKPRSGLKSNIMFKVFTSDRGVMKIFEAADSVKLDGSNENSDSSALDSLTDQVIRYKLNSKGQICEIDTTNVGTKENADSTLFVSSPMPSAKIYYKLGNFGGRALIDGQTVVFMVPLDRSEDEKYKVKSSAYFRTNYQYAVEAYNTEQEYSYADAVLMYSSDGDGSSITQNTYMAMVEKITRTLDDEGMPCYKLHYGISGRKESAVITDTVKIYGSSNTIKATDINPGSVIRIGTDYKSRINEIDLLYLSNSTYDKGEFKGTSATPSTGFSDTTRILFGYVYLTKDGVIKITAKHPSEMTTFDCDNTESRILGNFKCMMLDTTQKEPVVRVANSDDFMDYIHYGSDCSKVLVQTKNADTYTIMLVK